MSVGAEEGRNGPSNGGHTQEQAGRSNGQGHTRGGTSTNSSHGLVRDPNNISHLQVRAAFILLIRIFTIRSDSIQTGRQTS